MRIWLHGTAKTPSLFPWASFSVVTHAVLIGGAVASTDRAAQSLLQDITESIYYLPPPDRTPSSAATVERIRYVRVGSGETEPSVLRAGAAPAALRPASQPAGEPSSGADVVTQSSQAASAPSGDSVYSVIDVDVSAARMEGSAAPVYPAALRERLVEGSVIARYVVDSTGWAEPASLDVVSATHAEFAQAVRDALPGMRFRPGIVAGRPVRQLVEQRFAFRITPTTAPTPAEHTRAVTTP